MKRSALRRSLGLAVLITVLGGIGLLLVLLLPRTSPMVAEAIHEITRGVDPAVEEWSLVLRDARSHDARAIARQSLARGIITTADPRDNKIELIRVEREGWMTYKVTLGCYPSGWAGMEVEYRFTFRGQWRLAGRRILRQA